MKWTLLISAILVPTRINQNPVCCALNFEHNEVETFVAGLIAKETELGMKPGIWYEDLLDAKNLPFNNI